MPRKTKQTRRNNNHTDHQKEQNSQYDVSSSSESEVHNTKVSSIDIETKSEIQTEQAPVQTFVLPWHLAQINRSYLKYAFQNKITRITEGISVQQQQKQLTIPMHIADFLKQTEKKREQEIIPDPQTLVDLPMYDKQSQTHDCGAAQSTPINEENETTMLHRALFGEDPEFYKKLMSLEDDDNVDKRDAQDPTPSCSAPEDEDSYGVVVESEMTPLTTARSFEVLDVDESDDDLVIVDEKEEDNDI